MKEKIVNNQIFFLIILFGVTYCFLAIPSFFVKSVYFQEYGYFKNAYAIEQMLILFLYYLLLFVIAFFSKTKSFILIPKIKNVFFANAIFYFYCLIYFFSCIDFTVRNNYFLYLEVGFLQALSEIGYLVANSKSKFSFAFIYLSSFIFYFFLVGGKKEKRIISFLILLFSFILMFLSGRKEQTIASFCILFFFISKKFNLNYKLFFFLSLLLIAFISLFLNSVRGNGVDSLVNLMFFSQESYPVILGTYLPLMGGGYGLSSMDYVTSFLSTTFPFFPFGDNVVSFINKNVFHEFEYGPVISIFGYFYIFFPFSFLAVFLVFKFTNFIFNTIRNVGVEFNVFSFYVFIKLFFLLRNGILANYIADIIVLFVFCAPLFFVKNHK